MAAGAQMSQQGRDVVFSDQGVSVIFAARSLDELQSVDILV